MGLQCCLGRSVFTVMKKYETKAGKSTQLDLEAKRQMEDRIFNRMLVWLAVAVAAEIFFVLVNRFYVHARAGELSTMIAWHNALLVLLFAGVILFVVCLLWGKKRAAEGHDSVLPYALGGGFLVVGLCSMAIRMSHSSSHLVLGIIPGLAVLVIIFYLYQKEYFPCAVICALGILTLMVYRMSGGAGNKFLLLLAVTLVVVVIGLACMLTLRKNNGAFPWKGEPVQVLNVGANYLTYFISAALTAIVVLCPLALGSAAAYYGIWVLGAWVFILAVYFTSKLM